MTSSTTIPHRTAVADIVLEPDRPSRWERPTFAIVVTVLAYGVLVGFLGGRAHLGGDTGGRAAVLAAAETGERGHLDVGYWAGDEDPELQFHPLYYTQVLDGRAQQVSTVPMLLLARPLVAIGGERAALALPMAGAILAALAAAALARGFGALRPMAAYWLISLASPITIYALDLWEHTLGLACALWAIVVLQAAAQRPVVAGLTGGALFGLGATMRTEILVAGAVFGAIAWVGLLIDRAPVKAARLAMGGAIGVSTAWVANDVLERVVLGASLRSARAGDVAARAGTALADRVDDAWVTFAGLNYADRDADRFLGGVLVLGLALAAFATFRGLRRIAFVSLLLGVVAFAVRLAAGLSFLPGLGAVFPIVAIGAVVGLADHRTRRLTTAALLTFPAVWITAYAGMPGAQWGGRYLFVPGCVLAVVALVPDMRPALVRAVVVALGAVVTLTGVLYLRVRTDEINRAQAAIEQYESLDVDLIVSRVPFLWRELGSNYDPADAHLTVVDPADLPTVADVADKRGFGVIIVLRESAGQADTLPGYAPIAEDPFPWVGRNLTAVLYVVDETDDSDGVRIA